MGAVGNGRTTPTRSRLLQIQWSPTATVEERRAFYQQRLALFAKLFLWMFIILLSWVNVLYLLFPGSRPAAWMLENYVGGVGIVILATVKVTLLDRRAMTPNGLFVLDLLMLELIGVALGLAAYLASDKAANVYSMFIWTMFVVGARAYIIPSTGKRTLAASLGAFVPAVISAIAIAIDHPNYMGTPGVMFVIGCVSYAVITSVIAALGSYIVWGLRKQIQEARQIGQYTLVRKLGEGGMGVVYEAEHAMLRRPVALKMLAAERAGIENLARFEREVRLTSQLCHPNTVAVFDYGHSPQGVFYYVMEYLDGIDLNRLVERDGPVPAGRVIYILAQVCGALSEAHQHNLVHRDIKPANIMLCRRGTVPDVAKVLDFGLVKELDTRSEKSSIAIAGTPAYLPPEAVKSPGEVGPTGDLYGIGAVAYFLLTGKVVFDANNVIEMCVHHVNTEPPPPSSRTANPIPAELDALILECLSKDPRERPASAVELRKRLLALDAAAEWDEDKAAAWWDERGDSPVDSRKLAIADTLRSPITMTVDLRGRRPEALSPTPSRDTADRARREGPL